MADITEVVRCRRLEVVDEDGVVRFLVSCPPQSEDSVVIETYTPKGRVGFGVVTDADGPEAQVWWRGNEVAAFGLDHGEPYWRVEDGDG